MKETAPPGKKEKPGLQAGLLKTDYDQRTVAERRGDVERYGGGR